MAVVDELNYLSTTEKMTHKDWKIRMVGYSEAIGEISSRLEESNKISEKYSNIINLLPNDNNKLALEKALDVIYFFVERFKIADSIAYDICRNIVKNCLGSVRPKIKDNGGKVLRMLIEVDFDDIVIKEIMNGIHSKQPNIICGCTNLLKESLSEFGMKILSTKDCSKIIITLIEDRNQTVRDCGKGLILDIYQWVGKQTIIPLISGLNKIVLKEIYAEFEKISITKCFPTRYRRSESLKKKSSTKSHISAKDEIIPSAVPVNDPHRVIVPEEVMAKVPPCFYEKIDDKKWTIRKVALEIIEKLTNHEKLMSGDYGDLIKILLRVLSKDANITLVILTLRILSQLAKGLGKHFSPYAIATIQTCLDKFKEKKVKVTNSLTECIDVIYETTTLDAVCPCIISGLSQKNPNIKLETALFLNRIFTKSNKSIFVQKILKQIIPNVVILSLDNQLVVREASFQVLGTSMKILGESCINPFLEKLDNVRKSRIIEFCNEDKENIIRKTIVNSKKVVNSEILSEISVTADPSITLISSSPDFHELLNKSMMENSNNESEKSNISFFHDEPVEELKNNVDEEITKYYSDLNEEVYKPKDLSLMNSNEYGIKNDQYLTMVNTMKALEDDHIQSFRNNVRLIELFKRNNDFMSAFSHNPLKKMIMSIVNSDLSVSYCALNSIFKNNLLDEETFLEEYGPLLVIVVVKQLLIVIKQLPLCDNVITDLCLNLLQDLIFIIKQVVNRDNDRLYSDKNVILIIFAVFRDLKSKCQMSSLLSHVIPMIETLAKVIYHKTARKEIVEYFTLEIIVPSQIEESVLQNIDLHEVVESLYSKYVQINYDVLNLSFNATILNEESHSDNSLND